MATFLNHGVYLAGRPSRWALAHILLLHISGRTSETAY